MGLYKTYVHISYMYTQYTYLYMYYAYIHNTLIVTMHCEHQALGLGYPPTYMYQRESRKRLGSEGGTRREGLCMEAGERKPAMNCHCFKKTHRRSGECLRKKM